MNWKRILIGTWSWKRPLYSLATIYLSLMFVGCFFADKLIFQPPGDPYPVKNPHFIEIDGIAAYYRAPKNDMPTLLWSHGNAQNLASLWEVMDGFHQLGFGVMAYDYPGYGGSTGKPTEKNCNAAITKIYRHLINKLHHEPGKIILAGQSVGGGPTCWLAAREKHGGLALISPFLSTFRVVTRIPILPGDRFPNIKEIPKIKTPLLVIHGEEDNVIPYSHGRRLFDLSPSSEKTFLSIPNAGHNDLFIVAPDDILSAFRELAKEL